MTLFFFDRAVEQVDVRKIAGISPNTCDAVANRRDS